MPAAPAAEAAASSPPLGNSPRRKWTPGSPGSTAGTSATRCASTPSATPPHAFAKVRT
ncbi:MAG: hypothetical protein ACOYNN_10475 [Terrimicrobiaceae bacterium]